MRAFISFVSFAIVAIVAIVAIAIPACRDFTAGIARDCRTAMVTGGEVPVTCFGTTGGLDPAEFTRWTRFHRVNRVMAMTLPDAGVMSYDHLAGSGR